LREIFKVWTQPSKLTKRRLKRERINFHKQRQTVKSKGMSLKKFKRESLLNCANNCSVIWKRIPMIRYVE